MSDMKSDFRFDSRTGSVFVVAKNASSGKSAAFARMADLTAEYDSYLDDVSAVYSSGSGSFETSYLEGKEKLFSLENKASKFEKETIETLKDILFLQELDYEGDMDFSLVEDYRKTLDELVSELYKSIAYSTTFEDEKDIFSPACIKFFTFGPQNIYARILREAIDYAESIRDFLDETEKIWHLIQESIQTISSRLIQVTKELEKEYVLRFIGKGIEGHITYQTWARPPTLRSYKDEVMVVESFESLQVQ